MSLLSGWRETHSGCKLAGSAATSLKSKKVLSVAQRPRLRAFFDFALSRTNHPIFASKAVSRQPLLIAVVLGLIPGGVLANALGLNPSQVLTQMTVQCFIGESRAISVSGKVESTAVELTKRTLDPSRHVIIEEVLHVNNRGPAEEHVTIMKVEGNRFLISDTGKRYQGAGKLFGKPWRWTSWESWIRLEDGSGTFHAKSHFTGQLLLAKREFYDPQGKRRLTFSEEWHPIPVNVYELLHSRLRMPASRKDPLG